MTRKPFPIDAVRTSIARLMSETGEKPKPLANKLGLSETGIRDIFLPKAKSVGGPKLASVARHFGVSVEAIMDGTATTGVGPVPQSPRWVMAPIELPSEAHLRQMFDVLLGVAGIDDGHGEHAQALAEHFPVAFGNALKFFVDEASRSVQLPQSLPASKIVSYKLSAAK